MEKSMAQKLKELLAKTSQEDLDREWAEIEALGFEGPNMEEFIQINSQRPVVSEVNSNVYFSLGNTSNYNLAGSEQNLAIAA